jgi:hypothetical protein
MQFKEQQSLLIEEENGAERGIGGGEGGGEMSIVLIYESFYLY